MFEVNFRDFYIEMLITARTKFCGVTRYMLIDEGRHFLEHGSKM